MSESRLRGTGGPTASGRSLEELGSGVEALRAVLLRASFSLLAGGAGPPAAVVVGVGPSGVSRLRDASVVRGVFRRRCFARAQRGSVDPLLCERTRSSLAGAEEGNAAAPGSTRKRRVRGIGFVSSHRSVASASRARRQHPSFQSCFGSGGGEEADGTRVLEAQRRQRSLTCLIMALVIGQPPSGFGWGEGNHTACSAICKPARLDVSAVFRSATE